LPQPLQIVLEPRKSPVQARSAASVDAILEATIQVLLQVGKEQLTTTRVAVRAGVSVGTLYQYFPNKSSLLQAALKGHLEQVANAVELACTQQQGSTLREMAIGVINAYLNAKMSNTKTSVALYSVSSDVDGTKIVRQMGTRLHKTIVAMLQTATDPLSTDPQLVATMLIASMSGIGRMIVESNPPEKHFDGLRRELIVATCAYLDACRAA
jgi:AcrR family transcriptional regulator